MGEASFAIATDIRPVLSGFSKADQLAEGLEESRQLSFALLCLSYPEK
jgi:hypothetical protein